jgi:hypothetical protein
MRGQAGRSKLNTMTRETLMEHPRKALSAGSLVASTTGSLLLLHSTESLSDEDGGRSVLDVLIGRGGDHEGRDVDHLLANRDVSLSDVHSGLMNGLGEVLVHDNGLKSSLEELVSVETEDVIELSLAFLEESESADSSDEGVTFEESSGISLVEGEELSGSLSELSERKLNSPDFSLVTETVLTDEAKLSGKSFLIEGLSGSLRSFLVVSVSLWHSINDDGLVDPDSLGQ